MSEEPKDVFVSAVEEDIRSNRRAARDRDARRAAMAPKECPTKPVADRLNVGKPKLSLVLEAGRALEGAAEVLEYGMGKYSRGNWKLGLPATEIIDSLSRHMKAFMDGQDLDPESGCLHVDHILVNALFLSDQMRSARMAAATDDRSKL